MNNKIAGLSLLINIFLLYQNAEALPWPIPLQDSAHAVNKVYGDWNVVVFHNAIDIPAAHGTPVLAVEDGIVTSTGTIDTFNMCWVAIKQSITDTTAWLYHHIVRKDSSIAKDSSVSAGDTIGHICDYYGPGDPNDHIHFQLTDSALVFNMDISYTNPLDSLSPQIPSQMPKIYDGRILPHHPYQIYYVTDQVEDTVDSYESSYLRDSIDIIVRAGVNALGDTCSGVHALGFGVEPLSTGNNISFRKMFEMHGYIDLSEDSIKHCLTFAGPPDGPSSMSSHWKKYYVVTNCSTSAPQPGYGLSNIKEDCWPTKINIAGTANADSIEDAKFPDGYYVTTIKVWSHSGDSAVAVDTVLVANFRPKVKSTIPTNGQNNVPLNQHINVRFSEAMDQEVNLSQAITISPGVSGDWIWISDKEIDFTPDPSFVENTTYTVSLSSQLKDLQGQELIPYNFSFTTGTGPGPQGYPTRFQWEDVTSWDVSVSWFDNYYTFQLFGYFSFPFYGYAYDMIIFNRRGSIWFDTNRDWCHFDLPTAGGSGQPVMAVYNDSLRHLFGHYSRGRSAELFNPNREVVRWTYTYYADTTEFEVVLFGDGTIRFDYRKCDIDTFFDNDGGSGISKGDGIMYSSITANYGPVYELAPASFIFTTNPPPGRPKDLAAVWPIKSEFVNLTWRQNPEPDLAGYNIYRRHGDSLKYARLDSTTVNYYADTLIQLGNTYIYRITAFDTLSLESAYSDSVIVRYGPREVDNQLATAYNNASRIIRNALTGEMMLAYTSGDSISFIYSFDEGATWSHDEVIALGQFPALVLDSENDPCCLFGRWIGPSGFGSAQLYYTKYINNRWTTPALLMSVDSVYIGIPRYAIPAPSASVDPQDTIHVTWMSPMGQEYPHRFAVWYGNLYALDTIPVFNYVQLDTIWVYESSPCPSLAIDGSQTIHVVYETDPAAPTLFYRYREGGIWRDKEIIESEGCYYPDFEFFGDRVHLVWDYRYPDTTVAHELHYRSKSSTGWDTIMNVYEPLPFNVFGEPVNVGGWYTIWANQDIYYSKFNGTYWEEPETVRVTSEISAHPTVLFRQDINDTCLYLAWTEGDSAPYSIQFDRIVVPSVPIYYSNLGKLVQSPYCIHRDGYWIFGEKPYESVDYGNDSLAYQFTGLDPSKKYRLDLAYYFKPNPLKTQGKSDIQHTENTKKKHNIIQTNSDDEKQISVDNQKGIGRLIQELVVDGISLDTSFITPHKLVRVSIWLPEQVYADGEIIGIIKKVKGKVVVCGEISLYEFNDQEKGVPPEVVGGSQSQSEQMLLRPFFFDKIYPNPTKGFLKISFNSPDNRLVCVKLYDVVGRTIKTIFNDKAKIGVNECLISSKDLSAGVYFIKIETEDYRKTEKVIFLR